MRPVPARTGTTPLAIAVRFGVGLIALAAGVGIYGALAATRAEAPRIEQRERGVVVRAMTVTPAPAKRWWEGFGVARAVRASDVAAEVSGVVVDRPDSIDPGAWVEAGELLIGLDDDEYRQRLERSNQLIASLEAELRGLRVETESLQETLTLAEEAVDLTRQEVERLRDAAGRGAATDIELQRLQRDLTNFLRQAEDIRQRLNLIPTRSARLEAQIQGERATARLAELDVQRASIQAPFAGALQRVDVQEGERVNTGEPVARLVDLRLMETPLRVPVSAVRDLRVGGRVELEAEGPTDRRWTGTIARIAPEADQTTRTATIFVEIEQEARLDREDLLLPGQFLTAQIFAEDEREAIVIPRTAVIDDRVIVMTPEGTAQPRPVRISYHLEGAFPDLVAGETQWAVVEDGLAPGERIVISNLRDLEPGAPVQTGDDTPEGGE